MPKRAAAAMKRKSLQSKDEQQQQEESPPRKWARRSLPAERPPHWDWGEPEQTEEERENAEKLKAEVSALEESFKELDDYQLQVESVESSGAEEKENAGKKKGPAPAASKDLKSPSSRPKTRSSCSSSGTDGELPSSPLPSKGSESAAFDTLPPTAEEEGSGL